MLHPAGQPGRVDVDDQAGPLVEGDRQRLRTAHPPAPAGQREGAGERSAETLFGDRSECLVGALHDALGADVDPRAGRHLPVHGQAEVFEAAELGPGGPVADEVGVGQQHPRCPLVGGEHPDRAPRLHQHRLVGLQRGQGGHHRIEAVPVAGSPSGTPVNHQIVWAFSVLGVEVVHQHPQWSLGGPLPGGQGGAPRGADGTGAVHGELLVVRWVCGRSVGLWPFGGSVAVR
jgi:hypothetical protein